ncbi:MAG: thiamine phosphate synthase, partial [Actinomycetes bacterium]
PVDHRQAMPGVRQRVAADLAAAIHVVEPSAGLAQEAAAVAPEARSPRSGDQVTDRALTQLVAAADGAALAARAALANR